MQTNYLLLRLFGFGVINKVFVIKNLIQRNMKQLFTIKFLLVITCLLLSLNLQAQVSKSVHVETAGTISTLITSEEKYQITNLAVTGDLNGTDIRFIREMGRFTSSWEPTSGKLKVLDLSGANIVAGGDAYMEEFYFTTSYSNNAIANTTTSNNVIGDGMFMGLYLISVSIPESVTSIGKAAFSYNKLSNVTIPDNVTSIGDFAFSECQDLASVSIGKGVTTIGNEAFIKCIKLTSLLIPDNVTSIGEKAFCECERLNTVTIGKRVVSVGKDAFSYCSVSTLYYNATECVTFRASTVFYWGDFDRLIIGDSVKSIPKSAFENGGFQNITIGKSLTSIPENAFKDCGWCNSFLIPESVTSIGAGAFSGCTGLTSLVIPEKITIIEANAFAWCTGLTSFTIPDSVTSIGGKAFAGCTGLTSLTIPENVATIGAGAFWGCTGLTSLTIPEKIVTIEASTFTGCLNLSTIKIPESVTTIGENAFSGCSGLTSLTLPEQITSIKDDLFSGCTGLTTMTIPEGITSIGDNAFYNCTGITSLVLPESLQSIGQKAFSNCSGLISVTLPDSVTSIGHWAFAGCTGLASLTIPATVSHLGYSAFSNCSGLTEIHCKALVPLNILSNTFEGLDKSKCELYVPAGTSTTYKNTTQWKDFTHMIEELATKEYLITFDSTQYYIKADTAGISLIIGRDFYWDDNDLPCLPYTERKILLPYGTEVDSCIVSLNEQNLWKEDIVLATNPPSIPTGSTFDVFDSVGVINYPDSIYPTKNVFFGEEEIYGYVSIWVAVTPFIYKVKEKQVSFASSITVQLKLKQRSNISKPDLSPSTISDIKDIVINPEETDSYLIAGENTERGFSSLNVHAISNNGEVTIQLSDSYDTPLQLELFSIEGTKIKAIEINPGETEKTITGLKPGCYLFGLSGKSGERVNGKIMIK